MSNEAAARFRQAPARPHNTVGTIDSVVASGPVRGASYIGFRDRQEGRQCRRAQSPAPADARGRTAHRPATRDLPHPGQPGGRHPFVPRGPLSSVPSSEGADRYGDSPGTGPASHQSKAGNLGQRTPHLGGAMTVTHAPAQRASVTSKALRALILAYQAATGGRSPACRFVPSCSDYALEAVGRFGARKGIPLVVRRLVRCRPGGPFGLDPVPDGRSSDDSSSEGTSS